MSGPEQLRVAYILTVHRNPAQVARQVRRLAVPGTAFLIHVDRKSDPSVSATIRAETAAVEHCHLIEPQTIHWAHVSIVQAVLRGLTLLDRLGLDPAQTVLGTGQDYPIVAPEAIAARLGSEPESAHMLFAPLPQLEWWPNDRGGLDRLERAYVRLPRWGMVKTRLRRRLPHGWQPYGGAASLSLGRPHREYLRRLVDEDRKAIRFFNHVNVPDENFFQTVLMNSPLRDSVVNDHLLFARWQEGANHPDLLGVDDLDEVLASQALFARKFDSDQDPEVLDELERRVDAGEAR